MDIYPEGILDLLKGIFYDSWDDHVIFVLKPIYMVRYIYWPVYVEHILRIESLSKIYKNKYANKHIYECIIKEAKIKGLTAEFYQTSK